jgi:tripartite-type tricarboxylate transporter receptor subunit TctC
VKKRSLLAAAVALVMASSLHAQSASKPLRIVVSFAPGGPVDFTARTIAEPLGRALGRTVVIDNKPGANGAIGAAEVLRADPDGSTLWITSVGAAAINQSLYDKLPYNMQRDFAPVSLVTNNVEVFVTSMKDPARDISEFLAAAKGRKETLPIASSGRGSIPHLALAQMESAVGIDFIHVPYNGMAPALNDLLGGQVSGTFADVAAVMGQIKGGRLKALGIAAPQRHPGLPDVKTFEEQGIRAMDTNNWYGLFASAKTPPAVLDALSKAVQQATADPAAATKLLQAGAEPRSSSPQELAALVKSDTDKWARLIKSRNITADQ